MRGTEKVNHNRPAAVVFTGDVLKDILGNPSYRGKLLVDGVLVEGKHPPLIDEATWEACAAVRIRNQRRTSKTWTRLSYPLTPLLHRGLCGGPMHREASKKGHASQSLLRLPPCAPQPISHFPERCELPGTMDYFGKP